MMRRVRHVAAAAFVALGLSATQGAAQQVPGRVIVKLLGYTHLVTLDSLVSWNDVAANAPVTFATAKQTIDAMKLPITGIDSTHWLLANTGFKARRKVAGYAMSWAFQCGATMTGDYADTARLSIAYALFVEPTIEGHSRLGIAVIAGAETVDGTARAPWDCSSTGRLEQEIVERVRSDVARR